MSKEKKQGLVSRNSLLSTTVNTYGAQKTTAELAQGFVNSLKNISLRRMKTPKSTKKLRKEFLQDHKKYSYEVFPETKRPVTDPLKIHGFSRENQ